MLIGLIIVLAIAAGFAIGMVFVKRGNVKYEREQFIRSYVFSGEVFAALKKSHPSMEDKDVFLIARALRSYFLIHARNGKALIAMPSHAVDALWHEFILDTRAYHAFCDGAFGAYFHHVPAAQMQPGISSEAAIRRTWRMACLDDNINPVAATRLPLLFAIDAKLNFPGGNHYSLHRPLKTQGDGAAAGGCGGFACAGDGLSSVDASEGGGGSGGDSGGDGGGGGCGGGD